MIPTAVLMITDDDGKCTRSINQRSRDSERCRRDFFGSSVEFQNKKSLFLECLFTIHGHDDNRDIDKGEQAPKQDSPEATRKQVNKCCQTCLCFSH